MSWPYDAVIFGHPPNRRTLISGIHDSAVDAKTTAEKHQVTTAPDFILQALLWTRLTLVELEHFTEVTPAVQ